MSSFGSGSTLKTAWDESTHIPKVVKGYGATSATHHHCLLQVVRRLEFQPQAFGFCFPPLARSLWFSIELNLLSPWFSTELSLLSLWFSTELSLEDITYKKMSFGRGLIVFEPVNHVLGGCIFCKVKETQCTRLQPD